MITEAYSSIKHVVKYFGTEEHPGAHTPFNFLMITDVGKESNATALRDVIESWYNNMPKYGWANWVVSENITSFH